MAIQKTMRTRCLGGFPLGGYQNFCFQIWPKICIGGHFRPNIGIFGPMPDQITMQKWCLGVFSVTWVPKLLLPPIKIRIFGPKAAIFAPKYSLLLQRRGLTRVIWIWAKFGPFRAKNPNFYEMKQKFWYPRNRKNT